MRKKIKKIDFSDYGKADLEISLSERGLLYAVEKIVDVLIRQILNEGLPDYPGEVSLTNFTVCFTLDFNPFII